MGKTTQLLIAETVVKHLKKTIYILIIISFGFKCADNNCELKNGKYKVVYDKEFSDYPKFEFEINGQNLTEINSDSNRKFTIETLGENSFRLKSLDKQTDSLSELQKALMSNGKPYYEITDCKKDTIDFTMRVNLHVISHSGKFVRIK
jgi:hypothetical protein